MISLSKVESIAKIIGVGVGCFGVWTYINDLSLQKEKASVDIFEEYNQGYVLEARDSLGKFIHALVKEADSEKYTPEKFQSTQLSGLRSTQRRNYDTIIEYYDRVRNCVIYGTCDQSVIYGLVEKEAELISLYVRPMLDNLVELDRDHAVGLRCFSGLLAELECWRTPR